MGILKVKKEQYLRRKKRSKKSFPIEGEYRLCVYRSAKHIEAQIIDDFKGTTLVSVSSRDKELKSAVKKASNKIEISNIIGEALAKKAKTGKVGPVVLDRNGYPYHGRVKAFAEAARDGGLEL